jgi:hypothetical protein
MKLSFYHKPNLKIIYEMIEKYFEGEIPVSPLSKFRISNEVTQELGSLVLKHHKETKYIQN